MLKKIKNFIFYLKQQKWTHIVIPFFVLYFFVLIIAVLYDITITKDYLLPYSVLICGLAISPFLVVLIISIIVLLKILAIHFENIHKTNNNFLLHNVFYNIFWHIGIVTLLCGFFAFIYFCLIKSFILPFLFE